MSRININGILLFFLLCIPSWTIAQLRYPVVGAYMGKTAQDMAICKNMAYLFNNGGHCRVLNLNLGIIIREFDLASSGKNMHVATACFGIEKHKNDTIPCLYVAEYTGRSRCFVESVSGDSAILVQTIEAVEKDKNYRIQCWLVDCKKKSLYSVSGRRSVDSLGKCPVIIRRYPLPLLSDGNKILLTEKNKQDEFLLDFPNCLQGAVIRNGLMYIATGFQQSRYKNPRGNRSLKVIDLAKKKIVKEVDLTYITTNEPEGFDFYDDKALLFCGQQGGIYEIEY